TVALLHPGEMGAAIGACLHGRGLRVVWASAGRSAATRSRANAAGLEDLGALERALGVADIVLSVCPPHGALALAREVAGHGFKGVYVDANAISPATVLLAAIRALATHEGVEAALLEEWKRSQPELPKRSEVVTVQARKAWRWIGEMEEIAASFEAAGLPAGFHLAAADLYRRLEGFKDGTAAPALAEVTAAFTRGAPRRKDASGARRRSSAREEENAAPARFKFGTAAIKRDAAKRLRSLKRS